MKKCALFLIIFSLVLLMLSIGEIIQGFDYKNLYFKAEHTPSLNHNAYVGGDAFNYIINGTYFTGHIVLGCSLAVIAAIFFSVSLLLLQKEKIFYGLQAIHIKMNSIKNGDNNDNTKNE